MEENKTVQDEAPAAITEANAKKEFVGRQFASGLQFEEAVQRLAEEYEKHPRPAKGVFY